jgi:hypothetical protein
MTLQDTGPTWIGAFIGDVTLVWPSFVPATGSREPYTAIGLLEQTASGLHVRAVKVIPPVTRFSEIQMRVRMKPGNEEMSQRVNLEATFAFADGRMENVESELEEGQEPQSGPPLSALSSPPRAGVIYLVGNGFPCTTLTQREVAVHSFAVR